MIAATATNTTTIPATVQASEEVWETDELDGC
jgi:hypothetical protein